MAGHRIASLLKASPEGEGFHPSQTVTLKLSTTEGTEERRKNPLGLNLRVLHVPRGGELTAAVVASSQPQNPNLTLNCAARGWPLPPRSAVRIRKSVSR